MIVAPKEYPTMAQMLSRVETSHWVILAAERGAGVSGYIVYAAPDDFDVFDGQNQAEIRRAESLPKHCVILVRGSDDD